VLIPARGQVGVATRQHRGPESPTREIPCSRFLPIRGSGSIICNDWKTLNQNVAALQDRGHVLVFQPSAAEVHAQAAEWFKDKEPEIYEWFGKNLHRMREPSFRHYVRARELKAAGMNWTEVLAEDAENRRAQLAVEILASGSYCNTMEMVRAFVQQGGGCRATFFNYRRKLGNGSAEKPAKGQAEENPRG
jgi:hypothetical protein